VNESKMTVGLEPPEGDKSPNEKEIAIFLRGLADHLESQGIKEGMDPVANRFGDNLRAAGVSEERIAEIDEFEIQVDVEVRVKELGLVEMLEKVFGPGTVVTEAQLMGDGGGSQNAPSTNTPQ